MSVPVTVIGNVNVDLVMGPQEPWPRPGTEVVLPTSDLRVGGAAGNVALALAGLGLAYRLVANRGADIFGRWLAEPFGAAAENWPHAASATTISVGITHPGDERTFFTTTGHLVDFTLADVLAQLPAEAEAGAVALLVGPFVTPRLLPDYATLIATLRRCGFAVALDTGWPDEGWTPAVRARVTAWLPGCDHLLINEIEACGLAGEDHLDTASARLVAALPADATLVVKRGADGAAAWHGGASLAVPAPRVAVVDTIGAGDAFDAGYLACLAEGGNWREAVRAGVEVASFAVSTKPRRYRRAEAVGTAPAAG